ncbi:MAG TPA: hypothetical protein VFS50_11395 [Meiothermus sp.]|nr:hypothetical protein [Meiothermus sp.]
MFKKTLVISALLAATALAAPTFIFVKDAAANGMMMAAGNKEHIELAAYPGLTVKARSVAPTHATFYYISKNPAQDAQKVFDLYHNALLNEGWMIHGDMMGGKKDDPATMNGEATQAKGIFDSELTFKSYTITLSVKPNGTDRVEADLVLK